MRKCSTGFSLSTSLLLSSLPFSPSLIQLSLGLYLPIRSPVLSPRLEQNALSHRSCPVQLQAACLGPHCALPTVHSPMPEQRAGSQGDPLHHALYPWGLARHSTQHSSHHLPASDGRSSHMPPESLGTGAPTAEDFAIDLACSLCVSAV